MPTHTGPVETPPIGTIDEWLQSIGLGRFRELFAAQEIDDETLSELTELDLEGWGVPFGARKRLMRAIAERAPAARPPLSRPAGDSSAERRQVTAIFCDMVGSTELAARLDPRTSASSPATTTRSAASRSRRSEAMSVPTTATACSPASAGPRRMRTIPSARFMQPWPSSAT